MPMVFSFWSHALLVKRAHLKYWSLTDFAQRRQFFAINRRNPASDVEVSLPCWYHDAGRDNSTVRAPMTARIRSPMVSTHSRAGAIPPTGEDLEDESDLVAGGRSGNVVTPEHVQVTQVEQA